MLKKIGIAHTSYPLSIHLNSIQEPRNHGKPNTMSPRFSLFFEKAGDDESAVL